jgi:hypothetical protein
MREAQPDPAPDPAVKHSEANLRHPDAPGTVSMLDIECEFDAECQQAFPGAAMLVAVVGSHVLVVA